MAAMRGLQTWKRILTILFALREVLKRPLGIMIFMRQKLKGMQNLVAGGSLAEIYGSIDLLIGDIQGATMQ